MEHFIVFYNFFALTIGIVFWVIFIYIQQKSDAEGVKSFIYFYSSFTIISIIELIAVYVRTNCYPEEVKFYEVIRYLGNPVGLLLVFFTLPFFIHSITGAGNAKIRNILFGFTAILLLILNYTISLFSEIEATDYLRIISKDFAFMAMIFYCVLQIFLHFRKLTDTKERAFFLRFLVFFALCIPGIITDTFLTSFPAFKFFPLIYIAAGYLFLKYFYKEMEANSNLNPLQITDIPYNELQNRFGLTLREIEVIKLLAGGFTNSRIADELFISVNTVKSHIRNSYQKFGITNRIELLNLLNGLSKK